MFLAFLVTGNGAMQLSQCASTFPFSCSFEQATEQTPILAVSSRHFGTTQGDCRRMHRDVESTISD